MYDGCLFQQEDIIYLFVNYLLSDEVDNYWARENY